MVPASLRTSSDRENMIQASERLNACSSQPASNATSFSCVANSGFGDSASSDSAPLSPLAADPKPIIHQPVDRKCKKKGKKVPPEGLGLGNFVSISSSCDQSIDIANRNQLLLLSSQDEHVSEEEAAWLIGRQIGIFQENTKTEVLQGLQKVGAA